ncbi:MAG: NADPH-dependent glutamate synthase [Ruminococcaceae bacterium]|nr:NADPH-dependent glutamate synthase [Oscillospiraceae bacterium]
MPNMQSEKTKMKIQDGKVRCNNWDEVALGYTEDEAKNEAARCLHCKNAPCISGCPVNVQIPDFIGEIEKGNTDKALEIIKETNALPAVCGRVCPQEKQCEARCVRGRKGESVAIGRLERFAADHGKKEEVIPEKDNGIKIAVIGSGPSSLSCARDLCAMGYKVHIFEALHLPGGVLEYGIPEFRLPKEIVRNEIENIKKAGVIIETNAVIGKTESVDELFDAGFGAVYIGSGAGLPNFMGIEGESANGVFSANEYLTRINLMKAYREDYDTPIKKSENVCVIGGGNVAMDAARCAKRVGGKVKIIYRRSEEEMPARREEIMHAKEEGIVFELLTNPIKINIDENGNADSITCIKMSLGDADENGRRSVSPISGSEFGIKADTVIIAVGTSPNPLLKSTTPGLESDKRGRLITEDGVTTTRKGVFAGGDAVTGAATVIEAMGAGKKAAKKIDEYIKGLL